jgi:hypothetical protein
MSVTQVIDSLKTQVEVKTTSDNTYTVLDIDEQGNYELRGKYNQIGGDTKVMLNNKLEGEFSYGDELTEIFGDGYYTVKMSRLGEIVEMKDFDQYRDHLFEKLEKSSFDPIFKQSMQASLQQSLSDEAFHSFWESSYPYIPKKPVIVGETWSNEYNVLQPIPYNFMTYYTLKSVTENEIVITFNCNIKVESPYVVDGIEAQIKLSGNMQGDYIINRTTGLIKKGYFIQDISGTIMAEMNDEKIEIPMEILSKIELLSY